MINKTGNFCCLILFVAYFTQELLDGATLQDKAMFILRFVINEQTTAQIVSISSDRMSMRLDRTKPCGQLGNNKDFCGMVMAGMAVVALISE